MKKLDKETFAIANSKIEEYRKCNVRDILEMEFNENIKKDISLEKISKLLKNEFYQIVFANNILKHNDFKIKDNILSIEKSLDKPILLINYYKDENTIFENSLEINLKENIEVDILELFISNGVQNFIQESRILKVEKNSNLNYVKFQNLSNEDFLNIKYEPILGESANLNFVNLDFGSSKTYNNINTNLNSQNSNLTYNSLIDINKNKEIANIIKTIHDEKNTKSSVNVNHVLNDSSHAVFEAKSVVTQKGSGSAVIQNSKTTLLSDDASINANPRLEIFIDELTASHGATSGSLDEDALFYLQTRGLNYEMASKILLESIKEKTINKIANEQIKEFIKEI